MGNSSEENEGGFFKENTIPQKEEIVEEIYIQFATEDNPKCFFCNSIPIDQEIWNVFKKKVCKKCKFEKMKFITKTTCKETYLITEEDLKEFKCLKRINPHKGNWSKMNLYIEEDIKKMAIKIYESIENIEQIKLKRENDLIERKKKKLKKHVRDMRRKTFLVKEVKEKHVHKLVKNGNVVKCECGLEYIEEEM